MSAADAPHLLVVDDDARLRALLQRFLAEQGFRITAAADAAAARRALAAVSFDLLVLDVMMPGESGVELTEALRKEGLEGLTGGEVALLSALAARAGEVLSREEIATALGTPEAGERAIDVQVTRLRRKVEPDPREPRFIQTVRHRGYILRPGA